MAEEKMDRLLSKLDTIQTDVNAIKTDVAVLKNEQHNQGKEITEIKSKMATKDYVDAKINGVRTEIMATKDYVDGKINGLRTEIMATNDHVDAKINGVRTEIQESKTAMMTTVLAAAGVTITAIGVIVKFL